MEHNYKEYEETPFNQVTTPLSSGEGSGGEASTPLSSGEGQGGEAAEASLIDQLTLRMIAYDKGDPMRIHHLLKVHRFAQLIGRAEGLDSHTLFVLESAAVVHDIGIHPAEAKYGTSDGKLQEKEGPAAARELLEPMGYSTDDIDRICWLIAHHHTYKNIDAPDYQILVEADFLVNLYEDHISEHGVEAAKKNIFRTKTGRELLRLMYDEKYTKPTREEIRNGGQGC